MVSSSRPSPGAIALAIAAAHSTSLDGAQVARMSVIGKENGGSLEAELAGLYTRRPQRRTRTPNMAFDHGGYWSRTARHRTFRWLSMERAPTRRPKDVKPANYLQQFQPCRRSVREMNCLAPLRGRRPFEHRRRTGVPSRCEPKDERTRRVLEGGHKVG